MLHKWTLPLLLALGMTGCGGGGGGGGTGATDSGIGSPAGSTDYLPMASGDRWHYVGTRSPFSSLVIPEDQLRILKPATLPDGSAGLQEHTLFLGNGDAANLQLKKTSTALLLVFSSSDGPSLSSLGSLTLLRLPLTAGDSYEAYNHTGLKTTFDSDYDGVMETYSRRRTVNVLGVDPVTVPAGTYNNALKVVSQEFFNGTYSQDGSPFSSTTTTTHWFVPGIGEVKSNIDIAPDDDEPQNRYRELASYKINGQLSETTVPTVTQVTPAPGASVPGYSSDITVTFSENMDFETLVLTLTNASGQNIPASTTAYVYSNKVYEFTPNQLLSAGTYTMTVVSGTDALGNALAAPVSWTFNVP